jgi:hypothetical protein
MGYRITNYTRQQASKLGVIVKPSTNPSKKIDVFKKVQGKMKKVASVGAIGYNDYPTYMRLEREGRVKKGTAREKRKNYKARHQSNRTKRGTNGWYADKLLW